MSNQKIVKTTVLIREDVYLKAKFLASARGITFSELINEALLNFINKFEKELKERIEKLLKNG